MTPVLAIVGRPNVGKSTLFNRIVGRQIAIVHEQPGVTRDRVSAPARWGEKSFEAVDTGGIAFLDQERARDPLAAAMLRQAEVAIEMATVIVLVVDVTAGLTPLDLEVAGKLRASGKPVVLAVNKVDSPRREAGVDEFAALGFRQMFPIAAVHGRGVRELLDAATADFPDQAAVEELPAPRVAIVGKPNAGKSSLINCILQSDRTIVSEIPGTTRDSVAVPFAMGDRRYVLIDTAGLRHRSQIRTSVDQFGLMRAERSIRECDIAVLVMDAVQGVTRQDKRIGGLIAEARRSCVIVVNKWDLAAAEERKPRATARRGQPPPTFQEEYLAALRRELFFLDWAPVLFASAKTGERVSELFRLLGRVERARQVRADTPQLNQLLGRALESYPPPVVHGKRFKIYYAFQKPGPVPTFVLFVNDARCLTPHYERFLAGRLRSVWDFTGCPVVFECRARSKKISAEN
jgi:GTP-binding protein